VGAFELERWLRTHCVWGKASRRITRVDVLSMLVLARTKTNKTMLHRSKMTTSRRSCKPPTRPISFLPESMYHAKQKLAIRFEKVPA
jgi:hypothetical protein